MFRTIAFVIIVTTFVSSASVITFIYHNNRQEISAEKYQLLNNYIAEEPGIVFDIKKYLADNKITNAEFGVLYNHYNYYRLSTARRNLKESLRVTSYL